VTWVGAGPQPVDVASSDARAAGRVSVPPGAVALEMSQLTDRIMGEVYPEFSGQVDPETVEVLIRSELARWDGARFRGLRSCLCAAECAVRSGAASRGSLSGSRVTLAKHA